MKFWSRKRKPSRLDAIKAICAALEADRDAALNRLEAQLQRQDVLDAATQRVLETKVGEGE